MSSLEIAVSLLGGEQAAREAFAKKWREIETGIQFWSVKNEIKYADKLRDLVFFEGLDNAEASQIKLELDQILMKDEAREEA